MTPVNITHKTGVRKPVTSKAPKRFERQLASPASVHAAPHAARSIRGAVIRSRVTSVQERRSAGLSGPRGWKGYELRKHCHRTAANECIVANLPRGRPQVLPSGWINCIKRLGRCRFDNY